MAKSVMNRMRFICILLDLTDSWIALIGASIPRLSIDCLRLRVGHASCRRPRQKTPRMVIYTNHLPTNGLFLGASAEEYHREIFAIAETLSDRIARLSNQIVFQIRGRR